ncbi:unnamed protein product [Clonostachys rhizophaga]|uniref:Uncharacterized protein n=1 Tax=Clonostachys rhizophaga TaxID=160324 RepID=A0A9N9W695_9HYPO|nr:unnamed protein product [Clonostachys rhizophaga]
MAPNLQLGPSQASPSETAMFNLLKANLEFPASSTVKAKKLVDDMIFIYTSTEDSPYCSWQLWPMVVALAACIPPDHEWQASLVEALHLVRQLDDSVAKDDSGEPFNKLPDLLMTITEYWHGFHNIFTIEDSDPLEPGQLEQLARWKSVNSFLARVTTDDYVELLNSGIDQVAIALESEPAKQEPVAACYIWVATEWIIHCGSIIFKLMQGNPKISYDLQGTGSLCKDAPPQSTQRWEFWKERLAEFKGDTLITSRVQETIKVMNEIQSNKQQEE